MRSGVMTKRSAAMQSANLPAPGAGTPLNKAIAKRFAG